MQFTKRAPDFCWMHEPFWDFRRTCENHSCLNRNANIATSRGEISPERKLLQLKIILYRAFFTIAENHFFERDCGIDIESSVSFVVVMNNPAAIFEHKVQQWWHTSDFTAVLWDWLYCAAVIWSQCASSFVEKIWGCTYFTYNNTNGWTLKCNANDSHAQARHETRC